MTKPATALAAEFAAYCESAGFKETTFGKYAAGDSAFMDRLREGRVELRTIERVRAYIARNPATAAAVA